jgi:hypothetical protein
MVMIEFYCSVPFKQLTSVDSASSPPAYFLVETLRIYTERLLKLLVMNCRTEVSLMKVSGYDTDCSEPASSTKFNFYISSKLSLSLRTRVNWTTKWLRFLISWSENLELKTRRSLNASYIIL